MNDRSTKLTMPSTTTVTTGGGDNGWPAGEAPELCIDGNDLTKYLHFKGEVEEGPRKEIFYFADTGELTALRYEDWKAMFLEQKEYATLRAWIEPWTVLRVPLITNLRRDPYERAHVTSNTYYDWMIDRVFFLVPAQAYVADFLGTFKEFPPRQKPAKFNVDDALQAVALAQLHDDVQEINAVQFQLLAEWDIVDQTVKIFVRDGGKNIDQGRE